jgi:hypothetical protein
MTNDELKQIRKEEAMSLSEVPSLDFPVGAGVCQGSCRCPGLLDVTRVLREGHNVGSLPPPLRPCEEVSRFSWFAVFTSLLWRSDRKSRPALVTVRFCVSGTCNVINYRACRWMGTLDVYFLEWRRRSGSRCRAGAVWDTDRPLCPVVAALWGPSVWLILNDVVRLHSAE